MGWSASDRSEVLSCPVIVFSWSIMLAVVLLNDRYGNTSLLLFAPLIGLIQHLRLEADQKYFARLKQSHHFMALAAVYLLGVAAFALWALGHDILIIDLPTAYFVLLIGFPFFIPLFFHDLQTCIGRLKGSGRLEK